MSPALYPLSKCTSFWPQLWNDGFRGPCSYAPIDCNHGGKCAASSSRCKLHTIFIVVLLSLANRGGYFSRTTRIPWVGVDGRRHPFSHLDPSEDQWCCSLSVWTPIPPPHCKHHPRRRAHHHHHCRHRHHHPPPCTPSRKHWTATSLRRLKAADVDFQILLSCVAKHVGTREVWNTLSESLNRTYLHWFSDWP